MLIPKLSELMGEWAPNSPSRSYSRIRSLACDTAARIPANRSSLRLEASEFLRIDNRTRAEKPSKQLDSADKAKGAYIEYVPEPVFPSGRLSHDGVRWVEGEQRVDGWGGGCGEDCDVLLRERRRETSRVIDSSGIWR